MSDIAGALIEQGIRLRSYQPGTSKTTCPQCSHTRRNKTEPCLSVTIRPDGTAVWRCHHCSWSGGAGGERREYHARGQRQARPEPKRPAYKPDPDSLTEAAFAWFAKRGIGRETLARNRVSVTKTWMPGPDKEVAVMAFPYLRKGEVINVKYRDGKKHFRQEKGAEKVFFGLDNLDLDGADKTLIIVEGEIDALSLNEAGFWNVLSVPDGAPKQARPDNEPIDPDRDAKFEYVWTCRDVLDKAEKIILAVDADGPGQALETELSRRIGREKCWRVTWPALHDVQLKDANEVLVQEGATVLRECIERAQPYPIASLLQFGQFESEIIASFRGQRARGASTGLPGMDEHYLVRPGLWTVVTGYPGHGKSEVLDAMLVNLARDYGWKFALASFENPVVDHFEKLAQKYIGLPFRETHYSAPMGERELYQAMEWINDRFFLIRADDEAPTLDWILDKARAAVRRHGIRGLVIDPYNEIEHKRPVGMSETEYVSEIIGKVRRFAAAHDIHVWFVAHPAKPLRFDGKYPVPSLYDISGSAAWHSKADMGLVVYRRMDEEKGKYDPFVEVHIKKARFKYDGTVGIVKMRYDPVSGRYREAG